MSVKRNFQYQVVANRDLKEMADAVATHMADGWVCLGGVFIAKDHDKDGNEFHIGFQSMAKVHDVEVDDPAPAPQIIQ